ncbi:hypothetical protein G7K_5084-t1 [Saitoella complicata NRRL Y-17804]|uniref:mRNA 3'-end-processing protein n=1 Tax=Saitoella complicata (strain BCRC 22490 / CBS 7301 / JCM 7358 / NBRC 10748 / NRRL Y-17804) TaxID=698492 RepID=A0A0E9NME9_SAICN|nr:hypothetical protein G7K_5084-t1 [Saitoella complicata NRRL Y-17804]
MQGRIAKAVFSSSQQDHLSFAFEDYLRTNLRFGAHSPPQHERAGAIVCKHWLRGLCKKGDHCEFLHEYNLKRMPECWFFNKHGYCSNGEECLYLHIDPDARVGVPSADKSTCGKRCVNSGWQVFVRRVWNARMPTPNTSSLHSHPYEDKNENLYERKRQLRSLRRNPGIGTSLMLLATSAMRRAIMQITARKDAETTKQMQGYLLGSSARREVPLALAQGLQRLSWSQTLRKRGNKGTELVNSYISLRCSMATNMAFAHASSCL